MIDSRCLCLTESDPVVALSLLAKGYNSYPQCPNINIDVCYAPLAAPTGIGLGFEYLYPQISTNEIGSFECLYPPSEVPKIVKVSDENIANISQASWGETSSIYPSSSNRYNPDKWDAEVLQELLKARAAIHFIAENRNSHLRKASPNLSNATEKMLTAYHLTDNFPIVDTQIKDNTNVKWFFLGATATAKHTGINNTQKIVKAYGPFYNQGGGDAKIGNIYIIFYEATD